MNETIDYRPDVAEMLNQTLRNQETILCAMSRFIIQNRYDEDDYRWRYINQHLMGEYHRTREMLGEEKVGKYWKPEIGNQLR